MKALATCLVLLFGVGVGLLNTQWVSANQAALWTAASPTMSRNIPLTQSPNSECGTYEQTMIIAEIGVPHDVCIYGDERLEIGTFNEGKRRAAVQFRFSTTMHVLDGICRMRCLYSADKDMLVTQQQVSQYGWGLVVYRHVSSRIHRISVPAGAPHYVFDSSKPDYEMKNETGKYVQTGGFSVSSNGRWIVTELYDKGIAIIDTDSTAARQITTDGYVYGRGMDPIEEFAISDDGKSVVMTGQNAGFHIFDVTDGCGQELSGDMTYLPGSTTCPSGDLGIGAFFPNFASASQPRFYGDGSQLEVIVQDWAVGLHRVSLLKNGTRPAHQLKLLSLGDSFSSGEGETDDTYYEPGTNQGFDKCHVSTRAYPALVAARLGFHNDDVKNVACSGARITDIIGSSSSYWGQSERLGASGLGLSDEDRKSAQEKAIDEFQPGKSLQSNFIERYNPEILTIGVGGNDAGLMGKLRTCAMPGTCEWAQGEGVTETAGEIARLYDTLTSFFSKIKHDVATTHVYIVGYPNIMNPDGPCDTVTGFLLDHTERLFIKNSIQYLNQVIHAAAHDSGFSYLDIEHALDGSGLCTDGQPNAVNGVRLGDDISPLSALPLMKIIGAETFHPTPTGHERIADHIVTTHPFLNDVDTTFGNIDTAPSPYWTSEPSVTEKVASPVDFAHKDPIDMQKLTINVPNGALDPLSAVSIEIHSEPQVLATFVTNDGGGMKGSISIPSTIQDGFHTLHLFGSGRSGEVVDLYQFITIGDSGIVAGVGPADDVDDTSQISGGVKTIPIEERSSLTEQAMGVLGVQSVADIPSSIEKVLTKARMAKNSISSDISLFAPGLIISLAALVSILCFILVRRRWVKPSS